MEPTPPPTAIRRQPEARRLSIAWPDGLEAAVDLVRLRGQCPCARCVNEITGERMISAEDIDPKITIDGLELVGGYALKILWSDGHSQGLYTWSHLRQLCESTD